MSWLDSIENDPAVGLPQLYSFTATAGQSTFSGLDRKGLTLAYVPGPATILFALNGRLLTQGDDFTATDGSTVTLAGRSCSAGDEILFASFNVYSPADTYSRAEAQTTFTRKRNRIIDPGMRVSQENGGNAGILGSGPTFYASDAVFGQRIGATGGATIQRVAVPTPGGSPYRIRMTVTAGNAAPSATDFLRFWTSIEGFYTADLGLGTAAAKTLTRRIGVRSSIAGTFAICASNAAANRSWLGTVTIAPAEVNLDVSRIVTFIGDTLGAWDTGTGQGLNLGVVLCCGSTYQGALGWNAGNFLSPAGCTNLMATNGATFDLFDVGLYEGSVLPPFELPHYDEDFRWCQRYFQFYVGVIVTGVATAGSNTQYVTTDFSLPCRMRAPPSVTFGTRYTGGNSNDLALNVSYIDHIRLNAVAKNPGLFDAAADIYLNARL